MESTCASRCLLPALIPMPPTSESASAAPHKVEQLQQLVDSQSLLANKKPTSLVQIFFNRRPLDLMRRTTSSLLVSGDKPEAPNVAVTTPPATEERKFWLSRRPSDVRNGRRKPQQLQYTEKSIKKQLPRSLRVRNDKKDYSLKQSDSQGAKSKPRPTSGPLTGTQFLMNSEKAAELTQVECEEIVQFDAIFFVSTLTTKLRRTDCEAVAKKSIENCNNAYDTKRGDYVVVIGDHLAYRYEILSALGHGSFGQVVCCLDHCTRQLVAIKIIRNRPSSCGQALMEVNVLTRLQRAEAGDAKFHVARMKRNFNFRGHLCIVFEVLGMNLYDYLQLRQFRGLPSHSIRTIAKQLVQALVLLKQEQIIHCDLKPENILLDAKSVGQDDSNGDNVTLIDFGSCCYESAPMLTYVQSRFYRSPEVLLGHKYSSAIDMWSFACILVELHTGHPIFAGENEWEQLACIMEVLDEPPLDLVRNSKRRELYFDEVLDPADNEWVEYVPKPFENSRGRRRLPGSRNLVSAVQSTDLEFVAFLAKCFVWNPTERLTPEQALQEPWLSRDSIECEF
ncbi:hypothetical protein CCR75_003308 [Bremia lactucae]|uniref:Protein kinase domain-containing protein n=1 Tax=Bremia lactucae TaxID=4779 RepID=A0A976ILE9_BRELC|nr:hypothetical protein CCR75_003308 [Bremia lactucae]